MKQIYLENYLQNKKVLSGRDKGEKMRKTLQIDNEDCTKDSIEIIIPVHVYSFNSSFFLGLFGKSVRKFGKEGFLKKYVFSCSNVIMANILDGIEDALNNVDLLGGK